MWTQDEQEFSHCWAGLSLTAQDLARIAYLHLKGGVWDGRQIIPNDYVRAATTAQTPGGYPGNTPFGYLWWVTKERGHDAFYALGYGGRLAMVIPDLDFVAIIMTDDNLEMDHVGYPKQLVSEVVIPAVPA